MRYTPSYTEIRLQRMLDPRRFVRWVYIGRLSLAAAILLAAIFVWQRAASGDTLLATVAFAAATLVTAASASYTERHGRPLGRSFLAAQAVFDLLLVTAVVHLTGGAASQFTALYILVIASAALLLPFAGGLLVAALGCALYAADVLWARPVVGEGVALQLGVFAVVAIGSGYISARLREAGEGKEVLAAELVKVQLEAADILRNIRSGIMTIDGAGRLLYANPAAAALLGVELKSRVGRPVLGELRDVAPELARALDLSVQEGVRTTRGEGTIQRRDRTFPVGVTTTVAEGGGRGSATATAIFQDISDSKRLQAMRLRAERLEAVAELSASLAHEIKNPLASIRSAVEQLATRPAADEDERSLGALIVRESDRLSRLLSEFLDFARTRVSRIEQVDLCAVARGAANLAAAHPDRAPTLRLTCTIPREPLLVDADDDLLHRAVFNLVLNAVQAAPRDGHVGIEVAPLEDDQLPSGLPVRGSAVAVHVTDDGPGIDAEIRARVFDPFFTTKVGGSGLGLAIVHRAVEAHRGAVLLDTAPAGSRFTIVLPRKQRQGSGVPGPESGGSSTPAEHLALATV